jgi:CshA-type fibril repeat protein
VTYLPTAADDKSLGNPSGKVVTVSILGNDQGQFNVGTARLLDSTGSPVMNMVVAGQGTWHMNASTGEVTFTPQPGFTGDPAPVPYRVLDVNGNAVTANVTITYLHPTGLSLALTGMSPQTPMMVALAAIILGFGAMVMARTRRITARHRA